MAMFADVKYLAFSFKDAGLFIIHMFHSAMIVNRFLFL